MEKNSRQNFTVGLLIKSLLNKNLLNKNLLNKSVVDEILPVAGLASFNQNPSFRNLKILKKQSHLALLLRMSVIAGVSSWSFPAHSQDRYFQQDRYSQETRYFQNQDSTSLNGLTSVKKKPQGRGRAFGRVLVSSFFSLEREEGLFPEDYDSFTDDTVENFNTEDKTLADSTESSYGIVGGTTVEDLNDPVFKHTVRILGSGVVSESAPGIGGRTLSWRCSGTYLTAETVLTAAHCAPEAFTYEFENKTYQAGFSSRKFEIFSAPKAGSGEYSGVKAVAVERNPLFVDLWFSKSSNPWNPPEAVADLAIIKLEYSLSRQKEKIPSIAINLPAKGEPLILAGYGKFNPSAELELPQLRKAVSPFNLSLRNQSDFVVGSGDFLKPSSQKNPKGACYGDSGGPVYQEITPGKIALIGVISRGPDAQNGGCASSLSISTHVASFRSWLDAALKRMNEKF